MVQATRLHLESCDRIYRVVFEWPDQIRTGVPEDSGNVILSSFVFF